MKIHSKAIGMLAVWTLLIAAVDQGVKGLVLATMQDKSYSIIPGLFNLNYRENTGAAFSMFSHLPMPILLALNLVVLTLFFFLIRPYLRVRSGRFAAMLVLGGALGNLIDRAFRHYVIDYLDFHIWPVFNLADTFVVIGVALLMLLIFRGEHTGTDQRVIAPGGSST